MTERKITKEKLCLEFGDVRIVRIDNRNLGLERREAAHWKPTGKHYSRLTSAIKAAEQASEGTWFRRRLAALRDEVLELEMRVSRLSGSPSENRLNYGGYSIERMDGRNLAMSGPLCGAVGHYSSWKDAAAALLERVMTGPFENEQRLVLAGRACLDALENAFSAHNPVLVLD